MRVSPLRNELASAGATFASRHGVEVASRFADSRAEYGAVRDAAGITDFSFVRTLRVPEEKGIDFLDSLVAGNVPKIRFGRVLHTFMADDSGLLTGDCYIANNDTEFLVFCESLLPDAEFDAVLQKTGASDAAVEDLTNSHVLFSVDGFKAWEIVKKLFGADVLGLPYLSIENYSFAGQPIRLLRAGKTSEFGYLLLAPVSVSGELFGTLKAEAEQRGGRLCGVDIHDDLRLEGRFFNIHKEGARVRDPLALGLQWMIDMEKENFTGAAAIRERRMKGVPGKVIGIAAEPGCESLKEGGLIYCANQQVAEVVASCYSHVLNRRLGLALFPKELGYSGLTFQMDRPNGAPVRSISMPPIMPRSLSVKLDEM